VEGNVSFPLHKTPVRERKIITDMWLEKLKIDNLRSRDISSLSGGERQRVALARAMAAKPLVLFLDEPFSHVDRLDRIQLISTMKEIFAESATLPVLVTHDARDAFELTSSVLLLCQGKVVQCGKTEDVVIQPANSWVKDFLATE
jgi:ABC-type sulfate/molybdate transport systems ATPase subunit